MVDLVGFSGPWGLLLDGVVDSSSLAVLVGIRARTCPSSAFLHRPVCQDHANQTSLPVKRPLHHLSPAWLEESRNNG